MTQLLPVVLRGVLPENVRKTITKLCSFLNAISQKAIDPQRLQTLQNDVAVCLVSLELIFAPSFFDIMTHLLLHIVKEIGILGPVFLHNMFPFERYMAVLKKYVRKRSSPEGCIAKGYGTEEGYEINGYTFYTRAQDRKSTNQNSGVLIDAIDNDGNKDTYYGCIEEIWELEYGPYMSIPLFRCQWVKLNRGVMVDPDYGMPTVDLDNIRYRDDPFVLAKDVAQVFYVKDMSTIPKKRLSKHNGQSYGEPRRHIVLSGKRKIMGIDEVNDEEDYNKLDDIPPFSVPVDTSFIAG
ncbi:hypothetical protein U9M48_000791 [Paspalum notatum var. saurae]|uniref:Transposase n=1 Tax=Paspalum notatum var. saurae TaxID=547442 RepID=A0AAQ3SES3_PASNO